MIERLSAPPTVQDLMFAKQEEMESALSANRRVMPHEGNYRPGKCSVELKSAIKCQRHPKNGPTEQTVWNHQAKSRPEGRKAGRRQRGLPK